MKSQSIRETSSPSMVSGLIRFTIVLCLVAVPLLAQNTSQPAATQLRVVAPQLSQLDAATLQAAGLPGTFIWHYGTVVGLGYLTTAGGREVVIAWDQGGASRQQGGISDAQWEIFKLAFSGSSGRIAILSDFVTSSQFDLRFLEAQR